MITQASPLKWPLGWPRTERPYSSRFGKIDKPSIGKASKEIARELNLFEGTQLIISTNLNYRKDGMPYSNQKEPNDKGVAIYFIYNGQQMVLACDSFNKIGCNLWAIAKTIEAMRGIDRWGCSQILSKAFTGLTALPENTQENWWQVLQVDPDASEAIVKESYRSLAKKYHPDLNGDDDRQFKKIDAAYQKYLSGK